MNNLKSYTEYAVTTPTTDFVIGFDFNYGTDAVNVTVDDVPATEAGYSVIYLNSTTMRLNPAVPTGVVRLQRETDIDVPDNQFTAGAKFIASNMDENFTQIRHAQQEVRDRFEKLSDDTYEIIDTLQDVGQAAQDAADAAEQAAQTANDAAAQVNDKVSYQDLDNAIATTPHNNFVGRDAGEAHPASAILDASGVDQQEFNNSLAGVREKVTREMVSVFDFFTAAELAAYKSAPTTFDAYRPVQAFCDALAATDYGQASFAGASFAVSQGIVLASPDNTPIKTNSVTGDLRLTALNAIDTLLTVHTGQEFFWDGVINVIGTGSVSYASRTCRIGVQWGGTAVANRNIVRGINASRFSQCGLVAGNTTTLTNFGDVRANDCGSGFSTASYSLSADFSNRVDSGSSGSTVQSSTVNVTVMPPEVCATSMFAVINNKVYYIQSTDYVNNTITVFPWIDTTLQTGSLRYLFGAGVHTVGGDCSVVKFQKIDVVRCSIGFSSNALYPPIVDNLVTQFCGAGVLLGGYPSAAHVGGQINGFYCEYNDFDIVRATRSQLNVFVGTEYAFNINKVAESYNPRLSNNTINTVVPVLDGVAIQIKGHVVESETHLNNFTNSATPVDVTGLDRSVLRQIVSAAKVFNLQTPNTGFISNYAYDFKKIIVFGNNVATNYAPPSTITFNAPTGYTVNSGASAVFSGFSSAAEFSVVLQAGTTNFLVSCAALRNSGASVTYDPPSIASGAAVTTTVTLAGAVLGNVVQAAFSHYNADIEITAAVSAANTVTVKFKNTGASPVDLASGTLTVKLV